MSLDDVPIPAVIGNYYLQDKLGAGFSGEIIHHSASSLAYDFYNRGHLQVNPCIHVSGGGYQNPTRR
jgi:hypothetical protein